MNMEQLENKIQHIIETHTKIEETRHDATLNQTRLRHDIMEAIYQEIMDSRIYFKDQPTPHRGKHAMRYGDTVRDVQHLIQNIRDQQEHDCITPNEQWFKLT